MAETETTDSPPNTSQAEDAQRLLEQLATLHTCRQSVLESPTRAKDALLSELVDFRGMTIAEAGAQLDVSHQAINQRLARWRQRYGYNPADGWVARRSAKVPRPHEGRTDRELLGMLQRSNDLAQRRDSAAAARTLLADMTAIAAELVDDLGVSGEAIARYLGVSAMTVSRMRRGTL